MLATYIELGFDHILDWEGYDHILFVVVLAVAYPIREWRRILVLVTAFTVGHCLTLALAGLQVIQVQASFVELLIPVTIIISALLNIVESYTKSLQHWLHYLLTLLFGLIHGLGFSNFFKALVSADDSIVPMLLSFNIGVELGQLVVVALVLVVSYSLLYLVKVVSHRHITIVVSALCGLLALLILLGIL